MELQVPAVLRVDQISPGDPQRPAKVPATPRLLLVGEPSPGTSPVQTLVRVFAERGIDATVMPATKRPDLWVQRARQVDAVVFVAFHLTPDLVWRLEVAAAARRPLIRWWVGGDVYSVSTNPHEAEAARRLDVIVSANIVVAPHLQAELFHAGLMAGVIGIPSHRNAYQPVQWDPSIARTVVVYMPSNAAEFYGRGIIEPLAQANPDKHFHVVCDDRNLLSYLPNVTCYGLVEEMEALYGRSGCLLRMTRHDGLPRMIQEAHAHGLYVIYNRAFDHCIEAHTFEEAHAALAWVAGQPEANMRAVEGQRRHDVQREFIEPTLRVVRDACDNLGARPFRAAAKLPAMASRALVGSLRRQLLPTPADTVGGPQSGRQDG